MNVIKNEWTGLFSALAERTSAQGRKRLLFQIIGEIHDISYFTFGADGDNRPEPWSLLSVKYAEKFHNGDRTPKLILTGALREGFIHEFTSDKAILTNKVPYADQHQFGARYKNLPARPFYPVTPDGESLNSYAEAKVLEILDSHFSV